jgi:membrane protease YdiL (CAAX protease family)
LAGQTASINPSLDKREWLDLTYQVLRIVFRLAPVALVLYLLRPEGSSLQQLGVRFQRFGRSVAWSLLIAAAIGIPGIGLYLLARYLGLAVKVVPSDLANHWWTIPTLLALAAVAAITEETIVIGYLFQRLERIGITANRIVIFGALLRAAYHLYQGFGGFIGNLAMGIAFALYFKRTRNLTPLLLAHFWLDAASFVGYPLVAPLLP